MDAPVSRPCLPGSLHRLALAPLLPQLLGSAFNIWYNLAVVQPLLGTAEVKARFVETCVGYNGIVYPITVFLWLRAVYRLKAPALRVSAGEKLPDEELARWQRRVVHLPFFGCGMAAVAWLLCMPVFFASLWQVGHGLDRMLLWHLPISFLVSAIIAVTHSFFLVELASHRALYPCFFRDVRPDQLPGIRALSLRGRGVAWAISAGICPIGSLLLLSFAPPAPGTDPAWFSVFVGVVGIGFGLWTAFMMGWLVVQPIEHLREAARAVGEGNLNVEVPIRRADEFGVLAGEFNRMLGELRGKEQLRRTFGLHVGRQAAQQILARDPGLSGVEQTITIMFVDMRGFTRRSASTSAAEIVRVLNRFLHVMVRVVEERHGGMINKFLGDGFVALFGTARADAPHADAAVNAAAEMLRELPALNAALQADGIEPIAIGVGIHTGPAVVGSIGSPERLEFTAIGSSVNLASRIEGLTKQLGECILLSEDTANALVKDVPLRRFPPQEVRGLSQPVGLYTLLMSPCPDERRTEPATMEPQLADRP